MAVTAIWSVKGKVESIMRYTANPEKTWSGNYGQAAQLHTLENVMQYTADEMKTEEQLYVSGVNCSSNPEEATRQFYKTKRVWNKEDGIICFHGYQSFKMGELTPEVAHKVGIELARRMWGDRFEVLVSTHLNTGTLHNHFCLNSVSFADGLRYYDQKATYAKMRQILQSNVIQVQNTFTELWSLSDIFLKGVVVFFAFVRITERNGFV